MKGERKMDREGGRGTVIMTEREQSDRNNYVDGEDQRKGK